VTIGEKNQISVDLTVAVARRARQINARREAIARCRLPRPPQCEYWTASRVTLWQAQANEPKSPEAWAAVHIYSFLEELELSPRPERGSGLA
jgi:hypothetical protein